MFLKSIRNMHDELYEGFRLDEEEELDNAPTGEEEEKDEETEEGLDEEEAV